jgi:hypothetical protein
LAWRSGSDTIVNRAEAQVLRLSLIYAVLDLSPEIGEAHLRAAFALWTYAEDSAEYIFGAATGDPVAEKIIDALGSATNRGMERTAVSQALGRHVAAARLDSAFSYLLDQGMVTVNRVESTGGRPRTVDMLS